MKYYLGGTRKGYWRESLVPFLTSENEYIWPEDKYDLASLKEYDAYIFWFTPKQKDLYQTTEVFYALFWNHPKVFFGFDDFPGEGEFLKKDREALEKVGAMIADLGGTWVPDLQTLGEVINKGLWSSVGEVEIEA